MHKVVIQATPHKWTCSRFRQRGGFYDGHYVVRDQSGKIVSSNVAQRLAVIAALDVARKLGQQVKIVRAAVS